MSKAAQVAHSDATTGIKPVATNSVLDRCTEPGRACLEPGMEGLEWGLAVDRTMRSLLVVVEPESIELELEVSQALGRRLPLQVALEGLVEALDFAAGLGMVGTGVSGFDSQPIEL